MASIRRSASLVTVRAKNKSVCPYLDLDSIGRNLRHVRSDTCFLSHMAPALEVSSQAGSQQQVQDSSCNWGHLPSGCVTAVANDAVDKDSMSQSSTSVGSSRMSSGSPSPRDGKCWDFPISSSSKACSLGADGYTLVDSLSACAFSEEDKRWLQSCNDSRHLNPDGLPQSELDKLCVVAAKIKVTKSWLPQLPTCLEQLDSASAEKQRTRGQSKLEKFSVAGSAAQALRHRRDRSAPIPKSRCHTW